jgi:uroporphyrinogen-III synthase
MSAPPPHRQRLAGLRVLVPRPRERAEQLCFLLEDEGAEVLAVPLLELEPPTDPRPLRAAAELLRRFGWVAFASERGVTALVEAARTAGTLEVLRTRKLAAVGPGTAAALGALGLEATLVASVSTGEGLAGALVPRLAPGEVVLLPAAENGRPELEEGLRTAGVAVERVAAYRSRPVGSEPEGWSEVVAHPPRCVLFGSPRTVEAFLSLPGAEALVPSIRAVAVGPTTAAALRARGWEPAAIASAPTPPDWVEAAVRAVEG